MPTEVQLRIGGELRHRADRGLGVFVVVKEYECLALFPKRDDVAFLYDVRHGTSPLKRRFQDFTTSTCHAKRGSRAILRISMSLMAPVWLSRGHCGLRLAPAGIGWERAVGG